MSRTLRRRGLVRAGVLLLAAVAAGSPTTAQEAQSQEAQSRETLTQETQWPREIEIAEGKVVIYQPQPDRLDGDRLSGRTAISFTATGKKPIFGAAWFEALLDVDRDERLVHVLSIEVTDLRVADGEQHLARFNEIVKEAVARCPAPAAGEENSHAELGADRRASPDASFDRIADGESGEPHRLVVEMAFFEALASTVGYRVTADDLTLLGSGRPTARITRSTE